MLFLEGLGFTVVTVSTLREQYVYEEWEYWMDLRCGKETFPDFALVPPEGRL